MLDMIKSRKSFAELSKIKIKPESLKTFKVFEKFAKNEYNY